MLVSGRSGIGCGGCQHANMGMGCLGCPHNHSVNGLGDTIDVPMPAYDPTIDPGMSANIPPVGTVDTTIATGGGSGFNWGGLTTSLTNFGSQLFRAFGPQPNLIPGTNVVYNPQTGAYVPATGLSITPMFGSVGGLSLTTIAILGIVGLAIFSRK